MNMKTDKEILEEIRKDEGLFGLKRAKMWARWALVTISKYENQNQNQNKLLNQKKEEINNLNNELNNLKKNIEILKNKLISIPPPQPPPQPPVNQPTGLNNIGATCYMNATLQCLSNTKKLRDFFWNHI